MKGGEGEMCWNSTCGDFLSVWCSVCLLNLTRILPLPESWHGINQHPGFSRVKRQFHRHVCTIKQRNKAGNYTVFYWHRRAANTVSAT